jgi:hypothetical protein
MKSHKRWGFRMKKFVLLFFVAISLAALTYAGQPPLVLPNSERPPMSLLDEAAQPNRIVAYYFHGSFRCMTCHRIEQYSREAMEANFKSEMDSGKVIFKAVNVEEKKNEHFTKDYQLYTKSLVISLVKDGKEIKFQNLTKVWEYTGNKQKFDDYVKAEVANYLKEL